MPDLPTSKEKVTSDEARYLSRSGFPSYTRHAARALPGEPEALSEADLQDLTDRTHRDAQQRRREELERLLVDARREYEHLAGLTRHAEKQMRRLERRFRDR